MSKLIAILVSLLTTVSTTPTENKNEIITYGTFTYVNHFEQKAQFKSYDDEIWWYLDFSEIGFEPQGNVPYTITYDTNGTNSCNHTDCDNCWREDDILKKVEKFSKNY